jgi:hypothetical protein
MWSHFRTLHAVAIEFDFVNPARPDGTFAIHVAKAGSTNSGRAALTPNGLGLFTLTTPLKNSTQHVIQTVTKGLVPKQATCSGAMSQAVGPRSAFWTKWKPGTVFADCGLHAGSSLGPAFTSRSEFGQSDRSRRGPVPCRRYVRAGVP